MKMTIIFRLHSHVLLFGPTSRQRSPLTISTEMRENALSSFKRDFIERGLIFETYWHNLSLLILNDYSITERFHVKIRTRYLSYKLILSHACLCLSKSWSTDYFLFYLLPLIKYLHERLCISTLQIAVQWNCGLKLRASLGA